VRPTLVRGKQPGKMQEEFVRIVRERKRGSRGIFKPAGALFGG
jgi:hypothetical protein